MNKTDKILGTMNKSITKLKSESERCKKKATACQQKAQDTYKMPDKAMEVYQKFTNVLNQLMLEIGKKAYAKAQQYSRKGGDYHKEAERADRVADKFIDLIK